MKISVRESKLVVERLLLLTGLDRRLVPKVRDFLVASELAGGDAFRFLGEEFLSIEDLPAPRLSVVEDNGGTVVVDGSNQYAAALGPLLLNLMSVRADSAGTAAILIRNVRSPQLLNGLVPLANRRGMASFVVTGAALHPCLVAMGTGSLTSPARAGAWTHSYSARTTARGSDSHLSESIGGASCLILVAAVERQQPPSREDDTTLGSDLTRAIHDGIDVEEDLWWTLYHRSNDALTPTSSLSRTHAGPSVDKLFVEF